MSHRIEALLALSLAPTWLPLPGRRSSGTRPSCRALPRSERHEQMRAAAHSTSNRELPRSSELFVARHVRSRKCGSQLQEKQQKLTSTTRVSFSALLEKCRDLDLKPKHSEWSVDRIQRSYLGISLKRLNVDVLCRLQTQLWQRANSALFFAN